MTEFGTYKIEDARNRIAWKANTPFEGIGSLADYAVLAPSSHNTQPWGFRVVGQSLEIFNVEERYLSASDKKRRQEYISLGAAVANIKVAAGHFGYTTSEEIITDPLTQLVRKRFAITSGHVPTEAEEALFKAIPTRETYRFPHSEKPIPEEFVEQITGIGQELGVEVTVILDGISKRKIGEMVGHGMRYFLSDSGFSKELSLLMLPNTEKDKFFGMPTNNFGIDDELDSFDTSEVIRRKLAVSPAAIADGEKIKNQTASIVVLGTADDNPASWMKVGEVLQRIALKATTEGLTINPMAVLIEGEHLGYTEELRLLTGKDAKPQAMFRLGYPEEPKFKTLSSPRRPGYRAMEVGVNTSQGVISEIKPSIFKMVRGKYEVDDLIRDLKINPNSIIDNYPQRLRELLEITNPEVNQKTTEGRNVLKAFIEARKNQFDGDWAYFPWSDQLVHILGEEDDFKVLSSREIPCKPASLQERIRNTKIGVIGMSIGSLNALALAGSGFGEIWLADFDKFAESNSPRAGVGLFDLDEYKTTVTARKIWSRHPRAIIRLFETGLIDNAEIEEFISGINIVDDHFAGLTEKVIVRELARKYGVHVIHAANMLNPTLEYEGPHLGIEAKDMFAGKLTPEKFAKIRHGLGNDWAEWLRAAIDIIGSDNVSGANYKDFADNIESRSRYVSQLQANGYITAGFVSRYAEIIVSGFGSLLPTFQRIGIAPIMPGDSNQYIEQKNRFESL